MPWHRRKSNRIRRALRPAVFAAPFIALVQRAHAAEPGVLASPAGTVALAAGAGIVLFALLAVAIALRARRRADRDIAALRLRLADLRSAADRAEALVDSDDQRLVAWSGPGEAPLVMGRLPATSGAPEDRSQFLAFGTWLAPQAAARLEAALERLRHRGDTFALALETQSGRLIEASGRTSAGRAVARFRDLSGDRLALAELEQRHLHLAQDIAAMRAFLEASPMPAWIRGREGRLEWVNPAFARAVEASDQDDAVARSVELLDTAGRQAIIRAHAAGPVFNGRLPIVVAGDRRVFEVTDVVSEAGSAGIAADMTELETVQGQMKRLIEFHARTLDQLATAVAIFGADRRLRSYNAAFRALFGLDDAFLASMPSEAAVLDAMRAARRLPEQADFKGWRKELLSAYQTLDSREHWWHLPDGQTLRVIANPHPHGGMTWIYENVTERLDLESRYNALIQVQGETLDHLAEGVAVFGSDGRLRLNNPAFAEIWELDADFLLARPHAGAIVTACRRLHDRAADWSELTGAVIGLGERRAARNGRMERQDGRVLDYATIPLPNGQTMVTFVDVSDSVRVARALGERNEALEAADGLKNAFIQHVSYELRSPLTNIIGFAQLLADVTAGPLNDKQRDYTGYILSSSNTLLAIVNDILDLATVDAGIIALDLAEVDVAATIAAASEGVRDRMADSQIRLETEIAPDIGTFIGDEKRIRQILYNLLSNAVGFSPAGSSVRLAATRQNEAIEFAVSDQGPGISAEFVRQVFDRFESRASGEARGGAGLGLAIVKSFVELHGGIVTIESAEGRGTTVKVRLPLRPFAMAEAAE